LRRARGSPRLRLELHELLLLLAEPVDAEAHDVVGVEEFRMNLIPGLRLNMPRSGPSLCIGHCGAWFTIGPRGKRVTVGGLGTGLYYTEKIPPAKAPHAGYQAAC